MELLSLIDNNNIIVRYVSESVFGTEESSTPHVVIGIGRTIRAFQGNNFNMLRVVCIDDAETVVRYEAQKAFIRMLPPQCCVIFCTTNHTENLLTTVDSFGLSRKFIVNLTKRLPSNVKYNFITLNEEHEDYNPLNRYMLLSNAFATSYKPIKLSYFVRYMYFLIHIFDQIFKQIAIFDEKLINFLHMCFYFPTEKNMC